MRKLFPRSSLIAVDGGTSHANSLFGSACVDDTIAAYLQDGTLPDPLHGKGADLHCQPLPEPVPAASNLAPAATSNGAAHALELLMAGVIR